MPKKCPYDGSSMECAINDVKINKISLRAAAVKYGVPKSTLEFKLKNPGHKDTCGPSPILSIREELKLVTWIEELANRGFPRKKEDILNSVQQFLIENPRHNPFKNDRPGECWFKAFLRRHPTIVQRTSESVSSASACVSEADIRKWFDDIKVYLDSKDIDIGDPSRVFNGDETGFQICPSTGKVFAGKGVKNVYTVDKGSQKESITVMFSFSASGMVCPPMIIYPYKRIPEKIAITVHSTWGIGRSDNGWMTSETFYDYVKNIFYPHLVENNVQFPVILYLDGHKSHLTYDLSLLCNQLSIEVIALYPNATRILQPCDVAVFRPIKIGWKKAVREFYEKNPGHVLNKTTFAPLLEKVVTEVIKPDTLQNGFKACGLFPFNPNAVDYSKCLGKLNNPTVAHVDRVMDKNTFIGFIGDEIITKFKLFDAILIKEGFDNEFLTLHQMWNYFGKPDKEQNKTDNNLQSVDIEIMQAEIEPEQPDIEFENHDTELELPDVVLEVPSDSELKQPGIELVKSIPVTNRKNSTELYKNGKLKITSGDKFDPVATELKKITVIENIIIKQKDTVSEFTTSNNGSTSINNNNNSSNVSQALHASFVSKNINNAITASLSLPMTNKTCISTYLKVPDKPQRKNKRNVERVSFAITSRSYQESLEAKRVLKLEEENKKLERKRLREEKAAAKANPENKRVRKSEDVTKNGNCFMCKKRLMKNGHYITCDNCKNNVHLLCIPKAHKKHVPDVEDDDLFLCHHCYKEESDEEADSEEDTNENDEKENYSERAKNEDGMRKNEDISDSNDQKHEEKNTIDEEEEKEIDQLYNMYKDQRVKYY